MYIPSSKWRLLRVLAAPPLFLYDAVTAIVSFAPFLAPAVLVYTVYRLWHGLQAGSPSPFVAMLLPGLSIPIAYVPVFVGACLVTVAVHEAGHAAVALLLHVRLVGWSVGMKTFLPVAAIKHETVKSPLVKIRIAAAGVIANLVLVAIAWALVGQLPGLFGRWYTVGQGVTVVSTPSVDPTFNSFHRGQTITQLGDCPVTCQADLQVCADQWFSELLNSDHRTIPTIAGGLCIPATEVAGRELLPLTSLSVRNAGLVLASYDNPQPEALFIDLTPAGLATVARTAGRCITSAGCHTDAVCAWPLAPQHAFTVVQPGHHLISVAAELFAEGLTVTDYVGSTHFLRLINAPLVAHTALYYLIQCGLSVALLNLAPIAVFDGGQILAVLGARSRVLRDLGAVAVVGTCVAGSVAVMLLLAAQGGAA